MSVGERLRQAFELRAKPLGLTKKDATERLGVGKNALNDYFNGIHEPGIEFVAKFCDLLEVRTDYVLHGTLPIERETGLPDLNPNLDAGQLIKLQKAVSELLESKINTTDGDP